VVNGERLKVLQVILVVSLLSSVACKQERSSTARVAVSVSAREDYQEIVVELENMIQAEIQAKGLPALSISLVDDQSVVWSAGFGVENSQKGTPATSETIYRVGSVSKLFTDLAIMKLVEDGAIDLDEPVSTYIPSFEPMNGYDAEITLRHLMSHRSGLVREPPVGHYFDDTEPSLSQTVESLNQTELVYVPEERIKYSNAAIAVVGYVLEVLQGREFAKELKESVLAPLGMTSSSFAPDVEITEHLADAYMWGFDRAPFPAPTFQLGMAPAGSMYSSVEDLSLFIKAMLNGGLGVESRLIETATLEEMWEPQYAPENATTGYGLGFRIGNLEGLRRLGHGGAIYGFSTELAFLPEAKLGVVAVSSLDGTNAVVSKIVNGALEMMLAVQSKEVSPVPRMSEVLKPEIARSLEGIYGSGAEGIEFDERNGRLFMTSYAGGATVEVLALGDTLVVDGRTSYGMKFLEMENGLRVVGGVVLDKQDSDDIPPKMPGHWAELIGEYGWDHNVLYILERRGVLHALIEWFYLEPLVEIFPNEYAFPEDRGLYPGERLIFERNSKGRATAVEVAGIEFSRRDVGTLAGETFRIDPQRPVEELRVEALAARPPEEAGQFRSSELVEIVELESEIKLDVRYATTNNFMSSVFYNQPKAFLQRPAAEAVARAHRELSRYGFGLLIHDAYRPWYVTRMFWDATPIDQRFFVANPANGSRHNRGAAVDLTLYELSTGLPVEMVGSYDEFSPRSYPDYPGGTSRQRWLREILRRAMEQQGFTVYEGEWWHFDHESWGEYGIQNEVFSQIGTN
jgi:CubicO group peptidase (beta-lactamase class C family)/D-alanyl-D-alanine dipeptidase